MSLQADDQDTQSLSQDDVAPKPALAPEVEPVPEVEAEAFAEPAPKAKPTKRKRRRGRHWVWSGLITLIVLGAGIFMTGPPEDALYGQLAKPSLAPDMHGWIGFGLVYSMSMAAGLGRLIQKLRMPYAVWALPLVLGMMLAHEAWLAFLFRFGQPQIALWLLGPLCVLAFLATLLASRVDRTAGWVGCGFLFWLGYCAVWVSALIKLN